MCRPDCKWEFLNGSVVSTGLHIAGREFGREHAIIVRVNRRSMEDYRLA